MGVPQGDSSLHSSPNSETQTHNGMQGFFYTKQTHVLIKSLFEYQNSEITTSRTNG